MRLNTLKTWINISLVNLCIVASLGVLMRSKMVFDMPWIDYNRLVDTHGNFAFTGWVTIVLLSLMLFEFPGSPGNKPFYSWMLLGMALCSWGALFTTPFESTRKISEYISFIYIVLTYIFAWKFIVDVKKMTAGKAVKWLSIAAIIFLVLSSAGTIMLAYLFASKSLNAILYRDALFGYLHLQYNGFFSLSVFALIFNKLDSRLSDRAKATIYRYSILLSLSIIPSMFITFLWHDTNIYIHITSIIGSALLFLSFLWLIPITRSLLPAYKLLSPLLRIIIFLSIFSFTTKLLLQSLTIIHSVNVLVFGNRPAIMGFLHLVFLGFVTLFVLAYLAQKGFLNTHKSSTKVALIIFIIAVIMNESLLMLQGIGTMLTSGSSLFLWLLWIAGILLLSGALLVAISRALSKQ